LRLGAVLACDVAQREERVDQLLLWQPVTNGSQFLTQFLRLRLASEMLAGGAATSATRELLQALAQGQSLEIAGYELHPDLAAALERVKLEDLTPAVKRVDWMEVVADTSAELRPPARRVLETWRGRGVDVHAAQAAGEPFWSTIEIAECPQLLELTTQIMRGNP
jgi:exosortase A-associated hydrolase 2